MFCHLYISIYMFLSSLYIYYMCVFSIYLNVLSLIHLSIKYCTITFFCSLFSFHSTASNHFTQPSHAKTHKHKHKHKHNHEHTTTHTQTRTLITPLTKQMLTTLVDIRPLLPLMANFHSQIPATQCEQRLIPFPKMVVVSVVTT